MNKTYTWPGSNWRPSVYWADVIATRPQVLAKRPPRGMPTTCAIFHVFTSYIVWKKENKNKNRKAEEREGNTLGGEEGGRRNRQKGKERKTNKKKEIEREREREKEKITPAHGPQTMFHWNPTWNPKLESKIGILNGIQTQRNPNEPKGTHRNP